MFWNTLQDIELNSNRVLSKEITAVNEIKTDKLITHLNREAVIQQQPCLWICYRISTTSSPFPTLFISLAKSTKVLISTIVFFSRQFLIFERKLHFF